MIDAITSGKIFQYRSENILQDSYCPEKDNRDLK